MKFKLCLMMLLLLSSVPVGAQDIPEGSGSFSLNIQGTDMTLFSYRPPYSSPQTPIVFVLTGHNRNAEQYRDYWIEQAKQNDLTVIVPLFSQINYPGTEGYHLGHLQNAQHKPNVKEYGSFSVIERLFTHMQKQGMTQRQSYYLFGNSAGCQFAHRMLMFIPRARVKAAVCAAAGWWTLPDKTIKWPYGLKHTPVMLTEKQLSEYFAKRILITVGELDNDPNHKLLRRTPESMAQGDSRLSRAIHYYNAALKEAKRDGVPFNWYFTILTGAGHSGSKMSDYAAVQFGWFETHGYFMNESQRMTSHY